MNAFQSYLIDSARSSSTIKSYLSDYSQFVTWYEKENQQAFDPTIVTGWDLRAWHRYSIDKQRVAAATWNRRRAMLSVLADFLQQGGYIKYNIFQDVPSAAEEELAPRGLTRSGYGKFMRMVEQQLNAAKTPFQLQTAHRDAAMIALMVYCGLRVDEVANLNQEDLIINERSGTVTIHDGKGGKSGKVPVNAEARRYLRAYLEIRNPSVELFTGKHGSRISTRQIERQVQEIGRKAGVHVTPHMLRHTCATRLIQSGAPLTVVQKILRHARIDVTARYTKPSWDDLERAVGNL